MLVWMRLCIPKIGSRTCRIVAAGTRDMRTNRPRQPHLVFVSNRVADAVADRHTEPYTFLDAWIWRWSGRNQCLHQEWQATQDQDWNCSKHSWEGVRETEIRLNQSESVYPAISPSVNLKINITYISCNLNIVTVCPLFVWTQESQLFAICLAYCFRRSPTSIDTIQRVCKHYLFPLIEIMMNLDSYQ